MPGAPPFPCLPLDPGMRPWRPDMFPWPPWWWWCFPPLLLFHSSPPSLPWRRWWPCIGEPGGPCPWCLNPCPNPGPPLWPWMVHSDFSKPSGSLVCLALNESRKSLVYFHGGPDAPSGSAASATSAASSALGGEGGAGSAGAAGFSEGGTQDGPLSATGAGAGGAFVAGVTGCVLRASMIVGFLGGSSIVMDFFAGAGAG